MTTQELQFLKMLLTLTGETEKPFYYDSSDFSVHTDGEVKQRFLCNNFYGQVEGIIKSLLDKGYIESVTVYGFDLDHYRLTHKGLHPFQFSMEKILKFLFKSIIVPVIVAFLTALITTLVTVTN